MGDDSKEVKVGSLIAILAEQGEDWKQIKNSYISSTLAPTNTKHQEPTTSAPHVSDTHSLSGRPQ